MKKGAALLVMVCVILALSSCGKAETGAQTQVEAGMTVNFMVDGAVYETLSDVKKNTRIAEPEVPTFSDASKVFTAWYADEGMTKLWNFNVNIVNENISLYAGFKTVADYPGQLAKTGESLSSRLCWVQVKPSDAGAYEVVLTNAKTGAEIKVQGTVSFDNVDYVVTFTPTTPIPGGLYNVSVRDTTKSADAAVLQDVLFCGEGTQANPYLIGSEVDFHAVSQSDVAAGTYFKLYSNIEISPFRADQQAFEFNGDFNGNGRTITLKDAACGAIYKIGPEGRVYNLNVAGNLTTELDSVGGLVDYNYGTLEKITSIAYVQSTAGSVGFSNLAVTLDENADGRGIASCIAGSNYGTIANSKVVSDSTTTGRLAANIAGGLIAGINYGTIRQCSTDGINGAANTYLVAKSTSKYSYMGGIAGINLGVITQSSALEGTRVMAQRYADESLVVENTNNSNIGGIAGLNAEGARISECMYSGLRLHGDQLVGGIAGTNDGVISSCGVEGRQYAANSATIVTYVAGRTEVGGIAGGGKGTVDSCFCTANVYEFTPGQSANALAEGAVNSVCLAANPNQGATEQFGLTGSVAADFGQAPDFNEPASIGGLAFPAGCVKVENSVTDADINLGEEYLKGLGDKFYFDGTTIKLAYLQNAAPESTVSVILCDENGIEWKTVDVAETPGQVDGPYRLFSVFSGWATRLDGKMTFEASQKLSLYDLSDYADENGEIRLYAIQAERPAATKLKIAVWERYVNAQDLDAIRSAFEAVKSGDYEIEWVVLEGTASGTANYAVADFGKNVNAAGDFDVIIGCGANITSAGLVPTMSRSAIDYASHPYYTTTGRQAALLTDSSYATEFYGWLCGIENRNARVTLMGDREISSTLNSLVSNEASATVVTVPEGSVFEGWATSPDAREAQITGTINYSAVEGLLDASASVVLYPVIATPSAVDLTVVVWHNNYSWIKADELQSLQDAFKAYSAARNGAFINVKYVVLEETAVADLGAATNATPDADIIIGCGGNAVSKGNAVISGDLGDMGTAFAAAGRKTAVIDDGNEFAHMMYDWLCAGEKRVDQSMNVSVWVNAGKWITDAEIDAIKGGFAAFLADNGIAADPSAISWTVETATKVADLGASVNGAGNIDIIVGAGANVDDPSKGNVVIISKANIDAAKVAAGRMAAVLTPNSLAGLLYIYLTGTGF